MLVSLRAAHWAGGLKGCRKVPSLGPFLRTSQRVAETEIMAARGPWRRKSRVLKGMLLAGPTLRVAICDTRLGP